MAIREFFTTLPDHFRECRIRRHDWKSHNVVEHKKAKELEVVEICASCGGERTQILDLRVSSYGWIKDTRTRMKHPKGYLVPHNSGGWMTQEERGALRMRRLGY